VIRLGAGGSAPESAALARTPPTHIVKQNRMKMFVKTPDRVLPEDAKSNGIISV
jgi:hypothetical protein